ncbi:hypothetical protein AB0J51_18605 [Micromonospora echinofusca]|uniref:hypothetical protein n=1 Tax=Micromonospora echinofusca TaxID=47858 RepID=UPI0034243E64
MYQQPLQPVGGSLALSAACAALPLLTLFVLLAVVRTRAWVAAFGALSVAVVLSWWLRREFARLSEDDRVQARAAGDGTGHDGRPAGHAPAGLDSAVARLQHGCGPPPTDNLFCLDKGCCR